MTDYPDVDLVENLQYNVDHCDSLPAHVRFAAEVRHVINCTVLSLMRVGLSMGRTHSRTNEASFRRQWIRCADPR